MTRDIRSVSSASRIWWRPRIRRGSASLTANRWNRVRPARIWRSRALLSRRSAAPNESSRSASTGASFSAAALGVGARKSATKSAMVKSTSCPIAETTGLGQTAIARATTSSLKVHRSSTEPPPRVTAMQDAKKIAKRGATDAGHHADPARQKRNRPRRALPVIAQQPFLRQPLLELLKSQRERALPRRFDALDDQAVAAPRLVDVDASFHQNRESIAQFELHPLRDGRPDLGLDAGVLILEVEVQMPARISASKTRHFALNPDSRIFVLQQILDLPGQLAHGEHPPGSGFPTLDRRTLLRNGRQRRWNGWRRWVGRLLGRRGRP